MAKFAKLTEPNGEPVWIGMDLLVRRSAPGEYDTKSRPPNWEPPTTVIVFTGSGHAQAVREKPEDVVRALEDVS